MSILVREHLSVAQFFGEPDLINGPAELVDWQQRWQTAAATAIKRSFGNRAEYEAVWSTEGPSAVTVHVDDDQWWTPELQAQAAEALRLAYDQFF